MKKKRYTTEQIGFTLRQAEIELGMAKDTGKVCRLIPVDVRTYGRRGLLC